MCFSAIVYGRIIDGEEYTFGVSGKLIMNALVMYDHQTRTLWSQFLRKGIKGPLVGTELESIPVTQTTWSLWRELHPDTLVLDKRGSYQTDVYSGYYTDSRAGVVGESTFDERLNRKELVLGVDVGGNTKAYPFKILEDLGLVNDTFSGQNVLVFFDKATGTGLVYDREVDGRLLTFHIVGQPNGALTFLEDNETGSRWMAFTGTAIEGELKGKTLNRALSHLSFWFAWKDWNPDTELFTG